MIRTITRRLKGDPEDRAKQMDEVINEHVQKGATWEGRTAKLISVALENNVAFMTFEVSE